MRGCVTCMDRWLLVTFIHSFSIPGFSRTQGHRVFFAVAYQFSSISYLRAKAESTPGQLTSLMLMQSGRDSCAFLCVIAFLFSFFLGGGFSIRSLEQRSLHGWLLLLGSKEPRYQASSLLFAFMSTVCVLGLSCRQVFRYYHSLLILTWKWNEGAGSHFAILEAIAAEA